MESYSAEQIMFTTKHLKQGFLQALPSSQLAFKFSSCVNLQKSGAQTPSMQMHSLPRRIRAGKTRTTVSLYTDASSCGYGAFYVNEENPQQPIGILRGVWTGPQRETDSNYRELLAIERTFKALRKPLSGHTVVLLCDNQSVVSGITKGKMRGKHGELLQRLLKRVESKDIKVEPKWVSRKLNRKADALSKGNMGNFKKF
jgi:ribonuclease HI